jgi:hypothetical protein
MPLNKQDRIQLSAKLTNIPDEKKEVDKSIAVISKALTEAEAKDAPNKKIIEEKNILINLYQNEFKLLDGNNRTELNENVFLNSAQRKVPNSFFPNRPGVTLPSIPSGVWINYTPFSRTHAIGKNENEVYSSKLSKYEEKTITDINSIINLIQTTANIAQRATGKKGETTGFCSKTGSTQSECIANGGVWTPGPDIFVENPIVQDFLNNIKTLVQDWEDILNNQKNILSSISDSNSERTAGNLDAISDINNTISIINSWQSVRDFDTTTSLPSTISSFNSLTESYFLQTKLQPTTLQNLKNELIARNVYVSTRINQLTSSTYLGSIVQNMSDGSITNIQGMYGERMLFIDMRLNTVSGTLSEIIGLSNAKTAQDETKKSADIALKGVQLVIKASKAVAPGINTPYMNFEDLSEFSVGDRVYVVADEQEELSGIIEQIEGNRAKFTFNISQKYTTDNNSRVYKVL